VGVAAYIVRTLPRLRSLGWTVTLGLLLGGALGNLVDRLARAPGFARGAVVDFIHLPHFATFNVADSAITVGALLAVLLSLRGIEVDGAQREHGRMGG
jgi:signal peptidase II